MALTTATEDPTWPHRVRLTGLQHAVERGPRNAQGGTDRFDVGLAAGVEGPRQLQLLGIGQLPRPPTQPPPRPRGGQPRVGALPDQVVLELG